MKYVALSALALLSGCDSFHGVSRTIKTDTPSAHQCVQQALERIQGVVNIHYMRGQQGQAQGVEQHFYDYEYDDLHGRAVVYNSPSGTTFSQVYMRNRRVPPQYEIDQMRALMQKIEGQVQQSCKLARVTPVEEQCRSVNCPPLAVPKS